MSARPADPSPADDQAALAELQARGAAPDDSGPGAPHAPDKRKPSAADDLIRIGTAHARIVDERGDGYALVEDGRGLQTMRMRSRAYRQTLAAAYYRQTGRGAPSEAVATAVATLEAMARETGRRVAMHTRIAHVDSAAWVDLCDGTGRAVRVTADGWEVVDSPDVYWRRYAHQEAMPEPERGGNLRDLVWHVRVRREDEVLLLAWVVVALLADLDRAMPVLHGPPGSGKTTAGRMLRRIIDPSATDSMRLPRDEHALAILLDHHAAPLIDNLSGLPGWASDMLCTAVTGGAYTARELYSDADEVLLRYRVAPILTGIAVPATAPDLLDRALLLELEAIPPTERREAQEMWAAYEADRPRLLGAMLDTLAAAMRIYPTLRLPYLDRLADWTRWAAAVAEALGYGADALLGALARQRDERTAEVLGSYPVAQEILRIMDGRTDPWEGTAGDLHARREAGQGGWPRTPDGVARQIPRLVPVLAASGVRIVRLPRQHGGRRPYRITRGREVDDRPSPLAPPSPDDARSAPLCDPSVVTLAPDVVTLAATVTRPSPDRHHLDPRHYADSDTGDTGDGRMHTSGVAAEEVTW